MKKRTFFGLIDFETEIYQGGSFVMKLYNNNKTFFKKIIDVISGNTITRLVNKYNTDYRVQHFDTRSHIYSMLFFQMKGLNSLRDLVTQANNNSKIRSLINVPSVSQFSRKNAQRDYRVFEDLYYYLLGYIQKKTGNVKLHKDLPPLKIIDSTVVTMSLKLAQYFKYDDNISSVKISTLFNGDYPEKIHIVKGTVNDRKCIDNFLENKECIYIFDRGYYDYRWYDKLTEKGIRFVTRGLENASIMEESMISTNSKNDIYDTEVILGSTAGGNLSFNKYREIQSVDENGKAIYFITNIFDLSTEDIINIYKLRWKIELFFKWIKQNLRIKHCIGYSENSIKIQVYTALIVYLLLYILKDTLNVKVSMLIVTRIVRTNILENFQEGYQYLKDT